MQPKFNMLFIEASEIIRNPKDRISDDEKPKVIYKIPCKNCERACVGETGRPLGTRVKEHCKEVDSITGIFTCRAEKQGQQVNPQSQIMSAMRII